VQNYTELLEEASSIVERAGKLALSYFRQPILIEMKENHTPVTIADKKTEELIRELLGKSFPSFGIVGEEFGEHAADAEYVWTVDPIDGTRSFIRGIPLFGTLLGLLHRGEPVLGVMALPALDELYTGATGLGVKCNGAQMRVSATQTLESAFVSVGDPSLFEAAGKTKFFHNLMARTELTRGYTDCFGHALVIRGAVDAMIDPIVSPWDVAPIACLVREAGGDYCTFDGERTLNQKSFISFTPALKKQILSL
jgi:histidinol phosphatase-like enzyme (inositol monophosphatase family)